MNLALMNLGIQPLPMPRYDHRRQSREPRTDGQRPDWMEPQAVPAQLWAWLDDYDGEYLTSRELAELVGFPNTRVAPVLTYMHTRECVDRIPIGNGCYAYARAQQWSAQC